MGLPVGLHRKGGEGEEAGFSSAGDGLGDPLSLHDDEMMK
jgi:hypothetical protein